MPLPSPPLPAGLAGDLEEGPTIEAESAMGSVPCCERVALGVLRFLMAVVALGIGWAYLLSTVMYESTVMFDYEEDHRVDFVDSYAEVYTTELVEPGFGALVFNGVEGPALVWAAMLAPPFLTCGFLLAGDLFRQILMTFAKPVARCGVITLVGLSLMTGPSWIGIGSEIMFTPAGHRVSLGGVFVFLLVPILVIGAAIRAIRSHKRLRGNKSRMAMLVRPVFPNLSPV